MADGGEKASLGKFVRNQTKYGTTTKSSSSSTNPVSSDTFLKHYVKTRDTLQGIALKYGVTTEQIKRANNMWTNDSLFLREYLLIPLACEVKSKQDLNSVSPVVNGGGAIPKVRTDLPPEGCEIVTKQELQAASKLTKSTSEKGLSQQNTKADKKETASDFLSKFDSSLAKIKTNVEKLESSTEFQEDPSNPLNHLPMRRSSHNYGVRYKTRSMDVSLEDLAMEPPMAFKSTSVTRQVRTSLEKLDKVSDEMFQL